MTKTFTKRSIAVLAALLLCLSAVVFALVGCSSNTTTKETSETHIATDDSGNSMDGETVYAMPRAMAFSAAALAKSAAGISVNVSATVEPSTATNKAVDWSVMWADTTKTETVTDYVSVTPSSDGSTTATVTCYQAFGGDILLVVTTREGGYTADCVISFVGKPTSLTLSSVNANYSGDTYGLGVGVDYVFNINMSNEINAVGDAFRDYSVSILATGNLTVGTYEYDPRGSGVWYDSRSTTLSEFTDSIITYTVEDDTLHVTFNKSISGFYSSMVRNGTVKTYYNKVKSVDSDCYFTIYVSSIKAGISVKDEIKVTVDASVVTGVSITGTGVIEI